MSDMYYAHGVSAIHYVPWGYVSYEDVAFTKWDTTVSDIGVRPLYAHVESTL